MIAEEFKKLTLSNVASGAAEELFEKALAEVLENVLDENRDAEADRTITLTFKVQANRERNMAIVQVQATTKLAPVAPATSSMYFRRERGKPAAYAHNVHQPSLFDGNVTPIERDTK